VKEELRGLLRHLLFGHICTSGVRRGLTASLEGPPLELDRDEQRAVLQSIAWKAGEIMTSDRMRALDPPARGHLEWSAWILAAFQTLRPQFDSDESAIDFLGDAAMRGFNTRSLRLGVWLALRACRGGRLERARAMFAAMIRQYGGTFESNFTQANQRLEFHVTRCFYFDFFKSHDVPALTTVMCRLDHLWFDRIDPAKHGLRFDMAGYQTLSRGAEQCCFPIVQATVGGTD
jgi:hypothetical protein